MNKKKEIIDSTENISDSYVSNSKNEKVLLQVPVTGEISLNDVCNKEHKKLRSLLYLLEEEFNTKMTEHPEIRKFILDSSNFIKRIPDMVSEIVRADDKWK